MRIGVIAPPWLPVPPPMYGGIERVVDVLTRSLSDMGHEVRLFASSDSTTSVHNLNSGHVAAGITDDYNTEEAHVIAAYAALADCDVISDHTLLGPVYGASRNIEWPPLVATMHGPATSTFLQQYDHMASAGATLVAISLAQRDQADSLPVRTVIPHAVFPNDYTLSAQPSSYCLFVGRMHEQKAPHHAIDAARAAGMDIILAGKLQQREEYAYFDEMVRPRLGPGVDFVGQIGGEERRRLFSEAYALLAPNWTHEPFGLVVLESLASGTPVIATRFGAALELVRAGENGYLCDTWKEMAQHLSLIPGLSRQRCRDSVFPQFGPATFASSYTTVFEAVVREARP